MFVGNLDTEQQQVLLALAKKMAQADSKVVDKEIDILNVIRSQCASHLVVPEKVDIPNLSTLFLTQISKTSLLLELIGVANADGEYHNTEKKITFEVAKSLGFSSELFSDMESWVLRQFALVREANSFMEE